MYAKFCIRIASFGHIEVKSLWAEGNSLTFLSSSELIKIKGYGNSSHDIVHLSRKSKDELDNPIDKSHRKVTGQSLSMDIPCLKRFGENFQKMFLDFFKMPPFQSQTEEPQISLGVFIVLASGPSTDRVQHLTICNEYFFKKSRFLSV